MSRKAVSYCIFRSQRRELRLLCMLLRMPRGKSRSLPIQTLHRRAPFGAPWGRYPHLPYPGSVALDLRSLLPDGSGLTRG